MITNQVQYQIGADASQAIAEFRKLSAAAEYSSFMANQAAGGGGQLVAYWKFDETSGTTANDSSGYGNNGTVYGATWSGGCLSFDGVNDYINAGKEIEFEITIIPHKEINEEVIMTLLKHGEFMGLGQFRNGGYGRFEVVK